MMRSFMIIGAMGCVAVIASTGITINWSSSMPRGVWVTHTLNNPIIDGEVVKICPPNDEQTRRYVPAGFCPNGLMPLLKIVVATPYDKVQVSSSGISVNGVPTDKTTPLQHDSQGRILIPYKSGEYTVSEGTVWVVSSDRADGYDSRYFGPLPTHDVLGKALPMWTAQ